MYSEKLVYEHYIDQLEEVINRLDIRIVELTEENRMLRMLLSEKKDVWHRDKGE